MSRTLRPWRAAHQGLLAALGVFLSGFGVIAVSWHLGHWPADVPGLWAYRSATWGDGLLLPMLVGLLVAAGSALPASGRGERRLVTTAVCAGAAAGAAVQLLWLRDPRPTINWTVPAPGVFTAVGAYHAAFFITLSALVSAGAVRLLSRVRALRGRDPGQLEALLRSPRASLLVACALGFVGTVAQDGARIDDIRAAHTLTSVAATVSGLAAVIVFGVVTAWGVGTAGLGRAAAAALWGTALSAAFLLITWNPRVVLHQVSVPRGAAVLALALAVSILAWAVRRRFPHWWVAAATVLLLGLRLSAG